MTDLARLIDWYAGRGLSRETWRHYRPVLWAFADFMGERPASSITRQDCERFLNRWIERSESTQAQKIAALQGFVNYLRQEKELVDDPMRDVARPRRAPADELDVVTIGTEDVLRLFDAVQTWPEAIALGLVAYTGARRHALAMLRWRDVDLARGTVRFREKGGRVIVKPLAEELRELLIAYISEHDVAPNGYVIPNLRPETQTKVDRDDRIVWRLVKIIADRAGVRSHVHALRAAFAVHFLENHPDGTIDGLKELLGHRRIETTYVYLRRLDKQRQMEQVRGLSWGRSVLPSKPLEAHTGFEPVFAAEAGTKRSGREHGPVEARSLTEDLIARLRREGRVGA